MRDISDLASKAASQHGLLTTEQVLDGSPSRRQLRAMLDKGVLERIVPGVHRLVGTPPSWEQQLLMVCLAPGPFTVASHRSALRLWGMRSVDDEVEVTVRHPAFRCGKNATVHRSKDLEASDVAWVEGIPVTSPVRTICDAGAVFPDHEVQRILDHAIATGLVTRADMWRIRRRVGRQGRRGVGPLDRALRALPAGVELTESGPEVALLRLCHDHGLPRPTVQLPVVACGRRYRLDLAYPEARVCLEYDGFAVHTQREQFTADRRRQNDLIRSGWTILRFTHDDLLKRPAQVAREIHSVL